MRKKLWTIAVIAAVLLASCGKAEKQPNQQETTPAAELTPAEEPTAKSEPEREVPASVEAIRKAKIGEIVKFGNYEQDNNLSNGAEEIEWIVLDQKDDKYLLLSKYCLDAKPYNEEEKAVTWETCTLRSWLNDEFYKTAFGETERDFIAITDVKNEDNEYYGTKAGNDTKDKVYLLSIEEVRRYYGANPLGADSSRRIPVTEYAKSQGAWYSESNEKYGVGFWWLRSPGNGNECAADIDGDGFVCDDGGFVENEDNCVRPVIWLAP